MDAEPTLILDNINVFITAVAKARVEDLGVDMERVGKALKRLCESLVERGRVGYEVCVHHEIIEKPIVNNESLKEYARVRGIQNPSEYDLRYIGRYIFGRDITERLAHDDKDTLSMIYLEEIPFIRLGLREVTIRLGNDFPVERLRNKELRCHPTAMVHRLGAATVTCWVEVPTQLTVEDTNKFIHTLTKGQVHTVVHAPMKEQIMEMLGKTGTLTLSQYLQGLAEILLTLLIQVLRGEEPSPDRMLREDIKRNIEDVGTTNIVLHIGGVSMVKEDGSMVSITSVEDLVNCCPRQVAALATGRIDWRSYTLDEAVEDYREALAAIYRDQLVMAGIRGVVIYLREPSEEDFLKNVNSALRDPEHERHHHSVLESLASNVLQIYQLAGIVETALKSYNLRIRRHPLERARLGEIERLLNLVERGLEEIHNYSPVRTNVVRTALRMALKARGVLNLRKVVERRLAHMHRVLGGRASLKTSQVLLLPTIFLTILGVNSLVQLVQTFLTPLGAGFWPTFLFASILSGIATYILWKSFNLIFKLG